MTYGIDIDCLNDLQPDLRVTVDDATTLIQACVRRLQGRLFHDPTYGVDLFNVIGSAGGADIFGQAIEVEVEQDERVRAADFTFTVQDEIYTGNLLIYPYNRERPFVLSVTIDTLSGQLLVAEPIAIEPPEGIERGD